MNEIAAFPEKKSKKLSYENGLADCLEYTSKFTAAIAVFHLLDLGILPLVLQKPTSLHTIANKLNLRKTMLSEFLMYCCNENILQKKEDTFSATRLGEQMYESRGWFEMLIGGYGGTYFQMGECLRGERAYASRETNYVSRGSCNISRHDAIPLTKQLMNLDADKSYSMLDLGCGNGLYLSLFCEEITNVKAIGVEPAQDSYLEAIEAIAKNGLSKRISLYNMGAISFFDQYEGASPDYIIFAFVLHEILAQSGYDGLVELLEKIKNRFPTSQLIIIEVDFILSDHQKMKQGIEKQYYNPYYLIHTFTEQQLEPTKFWQTLFKKVGYAITKETVADIAIDPSKLEIGFLLTPTNT